MGPARTTLLLLAVAAGVAAAWLLLRGADSLPPPPPGPSPVDSPDGCGVVEGQVVRESGVEGVTVRLYREDRSGFLDPPEDGVPPVAERAVGEDGAFSFPRLAPGLFRVVARAPDGAAALGYARVREAGPDARIEIALPSGVHRVRGRAVFECGSPFPGLVSFDGSPDLVPTDPDGCFVLPAVRRGVARLVALSPGSWRWTGPRRPVEADVDGVTLVVDEGLGVRTGAVLDAADGVPVAGARVLAEGVSAGGAAWVERIATGADGGFLVRLPEGRGSVRVGAQGYAGKTVDVPAAGPVTVRLERAARIVGRVTGASGRPLPGVTVSTAAGSERAITGPDGGYRLTDLSPDRLVVVARGEGVIGGPLTVETRAGEESRADFVVVPYAAVRCRVLDEEGAPIPGVEVELEGAARLPWWVRFSPLLETRTGPDGEYRFEELVPGPDASVAVRVPSCGWSGRKAVALRPGETAVAEFVVPSARYVTVVLRDEETGAPIPGVRVGSTWRSTVVTGEDGRARVGPLPPGPVGLDLACPEHVPPADPLTVEEGSPTLEVVLRKGLAIEGILLDSAGAPRDRTVILLRCPEPEGRPGPFLKAAASGPDGRFRAGGLPAGVYAMTVGGPKADVRGEPLAEAAAGTSGLELRTGEGTDGIVVRLLDSRGRPVASGRARYVVGEGGGGGTEPAVVRNGRFVVPSDHASLVVRILAGPATDADGRALGALLCGPLRASAEGLELSLPEERVLAGRVTDGDGRPVPGVRIRARPAIREPAGFRTVEIDSAFSDEAGAFRIHGLGEFPCELLVDAAPEYVPVPPVPVGPRDVEAAIRLPPAARVALRILDGDSRPAARVAVELLPAPGTPGVRRTAESGADGSVAIGGLAAGGVYRLNLTGPPDRDDLMPLSIPGYRPVSGEIRMERAFTLAGTVVDGNRAPIGDATVFRRDAAGGWSSTNTDSDGRFRFRDLPDGDVVLRVNAGRRLGPFGPDTREFTVRAGTGDAILGVRRGATLPLSFADYPFDAKWIRVELTPAGGEGETRTEWYKPAVGLVVEIPDLEPGRGFDLFAVAGGGEEERVALLLGVVADGGVRQVAFRPPLSIRGRVTGSSVASGFTLTATGPGVVRMARAKEDGAFAIGGLPPGVYRVAARGEGAAAGLAGVATVPAGGEVVIEAKPGESVR